MAAVAAAGGAAESLADRTGTVDRAQYVTFTVGEREYGIEIMLVREIRQWTPTTELPNQPRHGRGVIDIRGEVVPVQDLRVRFGGAPTEVTDSHAILIVSVRGRSIGILVDSVSDIVYINADEIRPVPEGARVADHATISGLAQQDGGMVALLNIPALFGAETNFQPEADAAPDDPPAADPPA